MEKKKENNAGDGDDKNRVQMTNDERDDANDSQALTGGDITKYRALVARISHLSQDQPGLHIAAMQVCCAMANPSASGLGTRQEDWKVSRGGSREAEVLVPLAAEW